MTIGARTSPPKRAAKTGPPPPVFRGFRVFCTLVRVRAHHTRFTVRLRRTTSRPSPSPWNEPPQLQSVFSVDDRRNRKKSFSNFPAVRLSPDDIFCTRYNNTISLQLFVRPFVSFASSRCWLFLGEYSVWQARRTLPNRIEAVPVDMSGPTLKRLSAPPVSDVVVARRGQLLSVNIDHLCIYTYL